MRPDKRFVKQPKSFWAHVRSVSQRIGYTQRGTQKIRVPSVQEICDALTSLGLNVAHVADGDGKATRFGRLLVRYFHHRAEILNDFVEPRLMNAERAREVYEEVQKRYPEARCPIPMNKQKGKKKAPAFFTGIINTLIEANAGGFSCDYNPRELTTITHDGAPLRTLSRWVDGAFPGAVNPVAVWEIKEYYYTTTFGSRVADGVYETLLDGMELEELREHEGVKVKHFLMVDAHYTWWECGRSYLCRICDMLHMGYVDEVLFGYEVVERLPDLVKGWVRIARRRK